MFMTVKTIMDLLFRNRNERGMEAWKKAQFGGLDSYGIGLTQLKQLAKKIRRDHLLAMQLWASANYDTRIMGILIDEPAKVTMEQIEKQVHDCSYWLLSHVYCSCLLNKTPFALDLSAEWADHKDPVHRRCAYLLIYQIAQNDKKLHNSFFVDYLVRIERSIRKEENFVKDAMNSAMFMIGRRNLELNARAIAAASKIGPVEIDYGDNSCKAMNVLENLTDIRLQLRLKAR
jgi:3-methyladenine DNA glycosylase AlkD